MKRLILVICVFLLICLGSFAENFEIIVSCPVPFTLTATNYNDIGEEIDKVIYSEKGREEDYVWFISTKESFVILHLTHDSPNGNSIFLGIKRGNLITNIPAYYGAATVMLTFLELSVEDL